MGRMIFKLLFWGLLIGSLVYGYNNHWFDGVGKLFGAVKSDVKNQMDYKNYEEDEVIDNGVFTVEKEKKVKRTSGLGAVHNGMY